MHYGWLDYLIGAFVLVVQVLGVVFAVRALMIARTPQASIAWVFSLITIPYIAIPLFLVFGATRFSGYVCATSGTNPHLEQAFRRMQKLLTGAARPFPGVYARIAQMAERLTSLPAVEGNTVKLLVDGDRAFDAIFRAMDNARHYLVVQFFSISDDEIGKAFQQRLLAAAARGVRIWFLYDAVGSYDLNKAYLEAFRKAGMEVAGFVTNRQLWKRFQLNFRNHRKVVIADGKTAFIGGLNVGDKYMGRSKRFGPWRDTNVEMTGPVVEGFKASFIEDWCYATGVVLHLPSGEKEKTGNAQMFALASGPVDSISASLAVFLEAINAAQKRLWIASPYFVPDISFRMALQGAALRGVDVRLLLPQKPDHYLTWLSSFSFYPVLRRVGIKVYRYQDGFMHQKVLLADDAFAMVGSVNIDYRSFLLNFELTAGVYDAEFAQSVEKMLLADFAKSKEENLLIFEKGSLWFRVKVKLAALLSPEQ